MTIRVINVRPYKHVVHAQGRDYNVIRWEWTSGDQFATGFHNSTEAARDACLHFRRQLLEFNYSAESYAKL